MITLSRIAIIEDFIDNLIDNYDIQLFDRLSSEGMSEKEIYESDEWKYRSETLTLDDYDDGNGEIDYVISDFLEGLFTNEDLKIYHGAQQIVFIFDDIVYKISSYDTGYYIHSLRDDLEEPFKSLFPDYIFIKKYKNCYVYTQEKIKPYTNNYISYVSMAKEKKVNWNIRDNWTIRSDDCCAAIVLKYGEDFFHKLCKKLGDASYPYDIHDDNWGFNEKGEIRIFDPIYDECY